MGETKIQPFFLYLQSTYSITHNLNIDKLDLSPWRAYAGMSSVIGTGVPFCNRDFKYMFKHFGICTLFIMQILHSRIVFWSVVLKISPMSVSLPFLHEVRFEKVTKQKKQGSKHSYMRSGKFSFLYTLKFVYKYCTFISYVIIVSRKSQL